MNWFTNLRVRQLHARIRELLALVRAQNADLDTYRREVKDLTKLKNGFASENAGLRSRLAKALESNLDLARELDEAQAGRERRDAEIESLRAINGALVAENDKLLRDQQSAKAARPGFAVYPPFERGGAK